MAWPSNEPPGRPLPYWRPVPSMPPQPPVPPPPPAEPRGVLWAAVPLVSFGLGTPFSFLYAAVRRASPGLGVTALGYGLWMVSAVTLMESGSLLLIALGTILTAMLWITGSVHAFAVRPSIFPKETPRNRANEHAIQVAKHRRTLREEARRLAAEDPGLAHELRIGRPDLPRAYDDGGLIDVNHAPPPVLVQLPGLTTELVDRIVAVRENGNGFVSAEELAVDADLPPAIIPRLAEYTIFLP